MNFRLPCNQVVLLETVAIFFQPAGVKQTISSQFFSSFELGGIKKQLMTGPAGNKTVIKCLSVPLNVLSLKRSIAGAFAVTFRVLS